MSFFLKENHPHTHTHIQSMVNTSLSKHTLEDDYYYRNLCIGWFGEMRSSELRCLVMGVKYIVHIDYIGVRHDQHIYLLINKVCPLKVFSASTSCFCLGHICYFCRLPYYFLGGNDCYNYFTGMLRFNY